MLNSHPLNRKLVLITLAAIMVLTACAQSTPVATQAPSSETKPAATEAVPTEAVVPTEAPTMAAAEPGKLKEVPRENTLIDLQNGPENKWADYDNWNPYSVGAQAGFGANIIF